MFIEVNRFHHRVRYAWVWCFLIRISMQACLNKYVCDRSAAHSAQWQDLELIFHRHLQHGNRLERREGVAYASLRPAETFSVRVWDPQKLHVSVYENAWTIVSWLMPALKGLYDAYAACFCIIYTSKTKCAIRTYTQTLMGIIFIHGNGAKHVCLTWWWYLFFFDEHHL